MIESVLGGAAALLLFVFMPRKRSTSLLPETSEQETPTINIVGAGLWTESWWPMRATWPLVRLQVFSWGVRVSASTRLLRWSLPITEMRWMDIESATVLRRNRIRFRRTSAGHGSVSFMPIRSELIQTLRYSGVQVIEAGVSAPSSDSGRVAGGTGAPGWYPVGGDNRRIAYWDGVKWTAYRKWDGLHWVDPGT